MPLLPLGIPGSLSHILNDSKTLFSIHYQYLCRYFKLPVNLCKIRGSGCAGFCCGFLIPLPAHGLLKSRLLAMAAAAGAQQHRAGLGGERAAGVAPGRGRSRLPSLEFAV